MLGFDDKQDKRIANRIDWITKCLVILFLFIGEKAKGMGMDLKFPEPPQDA